MVTPCGFKSRSSHQKKEIGFPISFFCFYERSRSDVIDNFVVAITIWRTNLKYQVKRLGIFLCSSRDCPALTRFACANTLIRRCAPYAPKGMILKLFCIKEIGFSISFFVSTSGPALAQLTLWAVIAIFRTNQKYQVKRLGLFSFFKHNNYGF